MELEKLKYNQKLAFGDEVYLAKIVEPYIKQLEYEKEDLLKQNREICSALSVMYSAQEIRHQKYQRCLAMAAWCAAMYDFMCSTKYDVFWERWHKRWLKLAEQFKEAK